MENLPILLLMLMFGCFLYFRVFSTMGKGVFFNGKVIKTMASFSKGKRGKRLSINLKVHVVESSSNGKNIGLEISQSGALSHSMIPVVLSTNEAKVLADNLYAAIEFNER